MKARVQELIQTGDQLFSVRFPLLTLWQSFAENFYPIRADFTRARYISEEFASYLMTGRPVLAHRELANGIAAILRPRNQEWFKTATGIDTIDQDRESMVWLEKAGALQRRVMYESSSGFSRATKEGDADFVLFGQCVIEPSLNKTRDGVLYRSWHLRDCVWAENAELEIDQFHRKWELHARQQHKLFPTDIDGVTNDQLARVARDSPFTKVQNRVIVLPADEYDSYGRDANGDKRKRGQHPYVRVVVDCDNQKILEETPQWDLGHVIPRWVTIGGFSQYAYSPCAIVALPDARMLQQMTLTLIEIGQKIVDPPMIAVGDAIQGGTNLYAGAINWVDPDYDERTGEVLRPITLNGNGLQWGTEYIDKIEKVLSEAFYLDALNLPPAAGGDKMTATEVNERMKEYIRRATPLFEPMDVEYNGRLCRMTWAILDRAGAFGSQFDRPQMLRGRQIDFKFSNPLVQAEGERLVIGFTQASQLLGAAMQIDPAVRADFDVDKGFRAAFTGTGAPANWLVDEKQADAVKQQARAQQAAAQQASDLGHVGDQASRMANAVQNIGTAASALKDAGLAQ